MAQTCVMSLTTAWNVCGITLLRAYCPPCQTADNVGAAPNSDYFEAAATRQRGGELTKERPALFRDGIDATISLDAELKLPCWSIAVTT